MKSAKNKAIEIFPGFDSLLKLIECEISGLSDIHLNYTSNNWNWSNWSIRNQLSHMASLIPRWLLIRWRGTIFIESIYDFPNIDNIANSPFDRRLNDEIYWEIDDILNILTQSIELVRSALNNHTIEFIRQNIIIEREVNSEWIIMAKAHPTGITITKNPLSSSINLEATFRHILYEEYTHLYNIQRLKKAQGLNAKSNIPFVGYWALDEWDRTEPY